MSANPIPAPNDDSALRPIPVGEIEAVCSKHSIPCGEPDSLERFILALRDNKHLAMDFWSLVARLTDRYPSADSGPLLAAIVQGVTGRSLDDVKASGTAQQLLVREIAGLLAGEDVQPPLPPRPVQSARPSDLSHNGPFRLDAVPRRGAVPPPPSAPQPTDEPRLLLRSETPFAAARERNLREREPDHAPSEPELEIAIPLAAYAEENADGDSLWRKLAIVLLLLAAVGGALLYHSNWRRLGSSIHARYAAVLARRNHPAAPSSASINGDQATPNPPAVPATPQPAYAPQNPNPQPVAASPNAKPVAPQKPSPVAVATTTPPPDDTATRMPYADTGIAVPETVMRQHLVSSRVPVFPTGANGPVVIQAIVTARGTVEPLRVVSGDPALRQAAMAAVTSWQYRPYLRNGVPVDVSTTISVDSTGND